MDTDYPKLTGAARDEFDAMAGNMIRSKMNIDLAIMRSERRALQMAYQEQSWYSHSANLVTLHQEQIAGLRDVKPYTKIDCDRMLTQMQAIDNITDMLNATTNDKIKADKDAVAFKENADHMWKDLVTMYVSTMGESGHLVDQIISRLMLDHAAIARDEKEQLILQNAQIMEENANLKAENALLNKAQPTWIDFIMKILNL